MTKIIMIRVVHSGNHPCAFVQGKISPITDIPGNFYDPKLMFKDEILKFVNQWHFVAVEAITVFYDFPTDTGRGTGQIDFYYPKLK